MLSLQPYIEIAPMSHCTLAASVRRQCGDRTMAVSTLCTFRNSCNKGVQLIILIEMALQTMYIIRRPHDHRVVAVRYPHDDCSISVPFYGHCTGIVRGPCDSCAGAVRSSQEPTVIMRFFGSKTTSKNIAFSARSPCDHSVMPVRGSCNAPTEIP